LGQAEKAMGDHAGGEGGEAEQGEDDARRSGGRREGRGESVPENGWIAGGMAAAASGVRDGLYPSGPGGAGGGWFVGRTAW